MNPDDVVTSERVPDAAEGLALTAARGDGQPVGEFTLAGWVPKTGVFMPGAELRTGRLTSTYLITGLVCGLVAAWWVVHGWTGCERWPPVLLLGSLALVVQFFPVMVSNANVSLGVGFLLAACLMAGPVVGSVLVAGVILLWSVSRELLPFYRHQRGLTLARRLARPLYTACSSGLVYLIASTLAFEIFGLEAPVSRVTLETVGASVVLTVGVYVLQNSFSLVVSMVSGDDVASYLRTAIPIPALAEFLALPAALLLVVTEVRLGMAPFLLLAWLYLMAAFLGWRSWTDREALSRRLEDVELLHRVGEAMAGTLEMGGLILRFHSALREIVHFDKMLLVLRDDTEGMSQAFALSGTGTRGEVTEESLEDCESRPDGLFFNDDGTATYIRDFTAGEAATMRLRLDFDTETLPSNHKMVLLETVCQQAGTALSNGHLYRLANTDRLTTLSSRRYFERALRSVVARHEPFAVVMLDLDWFKKINDALGHRTGDEVLRDLARILIGSLRVMDVAARYGGEEFVILLPDSSSPEAAAVAERIRRVLDQRRITIDDQLVRYSASFGVACTEDEPVADDPMEVVWKADAALLEAKRAGRNQVVTYWSLQH